MQESSLRKRNTRTPSGNILSNKVSNIRTIFNQLTPPQTKSASWLKEKGIVNSDLSPLQELKADNALCMSDRASKQIVKHADVLEHDQGRSQVLINQQRPLSASINTKLLHTNTSKAVASKKIEMAENINCGNEQDMEVPVCEEANETTLPGDSTSVVSDIEKLIESHNTEEKGPMVMDVQIVHAMFKKMENNFQSQVKELQSKIENLEMEKREKTSRVNNLEMEDVVEQLDKLTIKTKAVSSAVQNAWEDRCILSEKLNRLETNIHKKTVVISGLYLKGKKDEMMERLENFFETEMGIRPFVEDFYETGYNLPTLKIVIFQSLRDKVLVMKNKSNLKGLQNKDKKPIYINNYTSQETNEKRRRNKEMMRENEAKEIDKLDMQLENNTVYINKEPFVNPLQPPNPQDILDYSTKQLSAIMSMEIPKGPEIQQDGNVFAAHVLSTNSLKEVQDGYLKLKLIHPKARHIMCAYLLEGDELFDRGYCDDGEFGASVKILEYLIEHNIRCRAIYVVRYYSGRKIGPDRFSCIIRAVKECLETYTLNSVLGYAQELASDEEEYDSAAASTENLSKDELTIKQPSYRNASLRGRGRGSYTLAVKKNPDLTRSSSAQKRRLSESPEVTQTQKTQPKQQTFNADGSYTVKNREAKK